MAVGTCPLLHSLSSRTSTSKSFSPASMRRFTSGTLVSLTRFFASCTSLRNCGECAMGASLLKSFWESVAHRQWLGGGGAQLRIGSGSRPGFLVAALACQGADQVHQVPAQFFRHALAFRHHFSFAFGDDVENFAVGHVGQRGRFMPV